MDHDKLIELAGDDQLVMILIVEDFRVHARELIEGMEVAWESKNLGELRGGWHQLKGASGSLGMVSFCEVCRKMEKVEQGYDWDQLRVHLDEVVEMALTCLRGERGSGYDEFRG